MTSHHDTEPQVTGPDTPVRTLMTRAVARISPDARLPELAHKLAAVEVGALAVGTTDAVVAIVSERDLTRAYGLGGDLESKRVGDIASTDLAWCRPEASAADAARLMSDRGIRHLLVGDGDTADLQGIVSARELIDALVR